MIIQNFFISEHNLKYTVLLNTIELIDQNISLNQLFNLLDELQNNYPNAIVQFFNSEYLLNDAHLFYAVYYVQKVFKDNQNISQKPSIEFLLYLSTNRQIKKAIEAFGISKSNLTNKILNYCICADENEVQKINSELLSRFSYTEKNPAYGQVSEKKYNLLLTYFGFSHNQMSTSIHSLGIKDISTLNESNKFNLLSQALENLIIERMALLSLE